MNDMLSVRKVNLHQHELERACRRWKTAGLNISISSPVQRGAWLRISHPDDHWRGWLFLPELLGLMSPVLAGRVITEAIYQSVINWLSVSSDVLASQFSALACTALRVDAPVVEGSPDASSMLCVSTPALSLWIDKVNYLPPVVTDTTRLASSLVWPIRYCVGYTPLRLATCRQVAPGDILLIQNVKPVVRCLNLDLFTYQLSAGASMRSEEWTGTGDLVQNDDVMETYKERKEAAPLREKEHLLPDINELPVELEFVLYRKSMTLAELQHVAEERLFRLPEHQEANIDILANGALIGRGELVQVENDLAVEITSWLGDKLKK